MKLSRKIILVVLSVLLVFSTVMFVACVGNVEVDKRTPNVVYHVGDNIDAFDFFVRGEGVDYKFTYKNDRNIKETHMKGNTFYAKEAGNYTLKCIATKDGKSSSHSVTFQVADAPVVLILSNKTTNYNYLNQMTLTDLVPWDIMFVDSESEYQAIIDSVVYFPNPYVKEGEELELKDTPTSGKFEGFYFFETDYDEDGNEIQIGTIKFIHEGIYDFHLILRNGGGDVDGTFRVSVKENISKLTDVTETYGLTYDSATTTASWGAVPGAAKYRVKIDYENVETEETSLDISPYLIRDFQNFDFAVIPLDENGDIYISDADKETNQGLRPSDRIRGYKLVIEDFIIAPEQCGPAVISEKVDAVEDENGIVTASLLGGRSPSLAWQTGVHKLDNNYVAWRGEYGIGNYVDFTFVGNNMPQVTFFANKINGDMSIGSKVDPNTGMLVMNGLYGAYSGAAYKVFNGDRVTIVGPNRFTATMTPENQWFFNYMQTYVQEYPLFTQDALSNDKSGTTYKYTVGTYLENGKIYVNMLLFDNQTGRKIYNAHIETKLTEADVTAGNIIAYAPVKNNAESSTFTFTKPYESDPIYDEIVINKGAEALDGTVTLTGYQPTNELGGSVRLVDNSFVGFKRSEEYGFGTYVEFTFKGNNMPQLVFFADQLDGCINYQYGSEKTAETRTGILLSTGMVVTETHDATYAPTNALRIFGPHRYDVNKVIAGSGVKATMLDYPLLTQDGLNADTSNRTYKYKVGTYDVRGTIYFHIILFDATTGETIYDIQQSTGITVSEMKAALGLEEADELKGKIIAYAAFKGAGNDTIFKYREPFTDETPEIPAGQVFGGVTNADGSVTLDGIKPLHSGNGSGVGSSMAAKVGVNGYLAFDGKYGVGTYVETTFKGNNMPIVMLFAEEIDRFIGCSSSNKKQGIVLLNGIVDNSNKNAISDENTREVRCDELNIWGPTRYLGSAAGDAGDIATLSYENYAQLTQKGLNENPDKAYKYIVGTYEKDGNIVIDIYLYDGVTDELIYHVEQETTIATTAVTPSSIVLLAAFKGADNDTTFSYKDPYVKEA